MTGDQELFTFWIARVILIIIYDHLPRKMTQRVEQSATVARQYINVKEKNIALPISHGIDMILFRGFQSRVATLAT